MSSKRLHVRTPLIKSSPLSKAVENGYKTFVASSGGNAGIAAAYAARELNVPIKIYVPSTTPQFTVERLKMEKANVVVHGDVWDEANAAAMKDVEQSGGFMVHPFNHPDIWEGHASMVEEICEDLDSKPDLIVTSIGGGGLALGILTGLERVGWQDVPLLGMETEGTDCFNAAVKAGKLVTLPAITSIAKCLGALTVAEALFNKSKTKPILSELVSDKECVQAMLSYLDDHKSMVEPACAAAIAAIYSGTLKRLQEEGKLKDLKDVVIIVCGGLSVNLEYIEIWKKHVGLC